MTDSIKLRPTVLLPLANAQAFLKVYFSQGELGGVLVPPTARIGVGDIVDLELAFAHERMVFHAQGIARWRRAKAQPKLPAGIGVEFLGTERRTRDLLLEFSEGKEVQLFERDSRRFPAVIVVEYKTDSVFLTDVTDNLSRGGAFVLCDVEALPPVGTRIKLKLRPPGFRLGIGVTGEVLWHRTNVKPGFGLRFVDEGRGTRKKLDELISRIKSQLAIG